MNASRRFFFRQFLGALTLAGITAYPYAIQLSPHTPLVSNAAHAQGNGSGGGKGNGSGNGNGGNAGGKGQGGAGSGGNTNSGRARARGANPPDGGIEHDNGMRETIQKGRYEMRDAQGRTIINRPATAMDYLRLKTAR
jgi:hypothetical protein